MITTYVHPRLGLPKFHSFEPFFISALEEFAKGVDSKFTMTGGLSPSTIAARMRDSLQGYRLNHKSWSDRVDPRFIELFTKYDGHFVIAGPDTNGEVWMRQRRKKGAYTGTTFCEVEGELGKYIKRTNAPTPVPVGTPAANVIRATSCEQHVVEMYAKLKGCGELTLPVIFPGPIEPTIVETILSKYDIGVNFDSQRNETILM